MPVIHVNTTSGWRALPRPAALFYQLHLNFLFYQLHLDKIVVESYIFNFFFNFHQINVVEK